MTKLNDLKSAIQIRIEHDDDAIDIIDKVNDALQKIGFYLKDDNEIHDGYAIFSLVKDPDETQK